MKANIKQLFEVIGTISIVLSLLFVGYQLLLERRMAEAEIYFNRAESRKSDARTLIESEIYIQSRADQWNSGWRPDYWNDELETYVSIQGISTEAIQIRLIRDFISVLHSDSLYFQYRQGLFSDEDWEGARAGIKGQLSDPLSRVRYQNSGYPALRVLVEELIEEIEDGET